MKAITVEPGTPGSARLEDVPEPDLRNGAVLVEAIAVGVCGTDVEIVEGRYGWAPTGDRRLVLGHESLGRVLDPGPSGLKKGDLVVGIVRRPDPVPCPNCAVGEWDMCRNGQYTERGIKQVNGFMSERWRMTIGNIRRVSRLTDRPFSDSPGASRRHSGKRLVGGRRQVPVSNDPPRISAPSAAFPGLTLATRRSQSSGPAPTRN